MKSYINTWKKIYAEEVQKTTVPNRNRNSNTNNGTHGRNNPATSATLTNNSVSVSSSNNNTHNANLAPMNPLPPLPMRSQPPPQPMNHHPPLPNHHNPPNQLNSYQMGVNSAANVMFDSSFPSAPQNEMPDVRDYLQMDKPPPMYPGHHNQHQQPLPHMPNPNPNLNTGYPNNSNLDSSMDGLNKGDWGNMSDRNFLQFALQVKL